MNDVPQKNDDEATAEPAVNETEAVKRPAAEMDEKQARTTAMLCHLTALAFLVGVPFGNVLGPLLVWLIKKDQHPLVDKEGKESLNFQISMTIYGLISALLVVVLVGIPMLIVLVVADLILVIVAAVKVSNGETYRYPLTIRFFK